jgi:hypothetical protein
VLKKLYHDGRKIRIIIFRGFGRFYFRLAIESLGRKIRGSRRVMIRRNNLPLRSFYWASRCRGFAALGLAIPALICALAKVAATLWIDA